MPPLRKPQASTAYAVYSGWVSSISKLILFLLLCWVPCQTSWWSTGSYSFPSYTSMPRSPHFWLNSIQPSMYVYICHHQTTTIKLKVKLIALVSEFVSFQNKLIFYPFSSLIFLYGMTNYSYHILYQYITGGVQYYFLQTRIIFMQFTTYKDFCAWSCPLSFPDYKPG